MKKTLTTLTLVSMLALTGCAFSPDADEENPSTSNSQPTQGQSASPTPSSPEATPSSTPTAQDEEQQQVADFVEEFHSTATSEETANNILTYVRENGLDTSGSEMSEEHARDLLAKFENQYGPYYWESSHGTTAEEKAIPFMHYMLTTSGVFLELNDHVVEVEPFGVPYFDKISFEIEPESVILNEEKDKATIDASDIKVLYAEEELFFADFEDVPAGGMSYDRDSIELMKKDDKWYIVQDVIPEEAEGSSDTPTTSA